MYPRRDSNPDFRRERAANLPLFDRDMRHGFLLPGTAAKTGPVGRHRLMSYDN